MATNDPFDDILNSISNEERIIREQDEKGTSKDSMHWLADNATLLANMGNSKVKSFKSFPKGLDSSFITNSLDILAVGRMFMYSYDPKTKDKLPYYDTFPLILLVDYTADGWYGLNLHYLPPLLRSKIIDSLRVYLDDDTISETKKVQLSYKVLKQSSQFPAIQHCFKRYLAGHVRSSFLFVDPKDWNKAVLLPTERFKKQSKATVHRVFTAKNKKSK